MPSKVIEVCYDVDRIPGCSNQNPQNPTALSFRDAALRVVEDALLMADLGAGIDASVGAGEVSFRVVVADFEEAERAIWDAVWNTPYHAIRELMRYWEADLAA
ncbi:MAG: hypothetical protein P8X50_07410 [Maritimibacter sp.]